MFLVSVMAPPAPEKPLSLAVTTRVSVPLKADRLVYTTALAFVSVAFNAASGATIVTLPELLPEIWLALIPFATPALTTMLPFAAVMVKFKLFVPTSRSVTRIPPATIAAPAFPANGPGTVSTGGLFDAVQENRKNTCVLVVPSLTEIPIRVVPVRFAAGVRVSVRLVLVPDRTILFVGSKVVLEELSVIVSADAAVSTSQTVKGI